MSFQFPTSRCFSLNLSYTLDIVPEYEFIVESDSAKDTIDFELETFDVSITCHCYFVQIVSMREAMSLHIEPLAESVDRKKITHSVLCKSLALIVIIPIFSWFARRPSKILSDSDSPLPPVRKVVQCVRRWRIVARTKRMCRS